ncbi:unnamed protein product [Tetraodon nigroviridis]|uniref:(spotted green pufferfish) hypothetical protein n=1 Tax=Tetraodon nigroviridis TaxID=99883 RepID=Q4SPY9_TETNG|nr:unnamed protein product [Tetraodon nigroviridis]
MRCWKQRHAGAERLLCWAEGDDKSIGGNQPSRSSRSTLVAMFKQPAALKTQRHRPQPPVISPARCGSSTAVRREHPELKEMLMKYGPGLHACVQKNQEKAVARADPPSWCKNESQRLLANPSPTTPSGNSSRELDETRSTCAPEGPEDTKLAIMFHYAVKSPANNQQPLCSSPIVRQPAMKQASRQREGDGPDDQSSHQVIMSVFRKGDSALKKVCVQ